MLCTCGQLFPGAARPKAPRSQAHDRQVAGALGRAQRAARPGGQAAACTPPGAASG